MHSRCSINGGKVSGGLYHGAGKTVALIVPDFLERRCLVKEKGGVGERFGVAAARPPAQHCSHHAQQNSLLSISLNTPTPS